MKGEGGKGLVGSGRIECVPYSAIYYYVNFFCSCTFLCMLTQIICLDRC